ncbi:hypothetical protein QO012_001115 [Methylobacterium aerolatum]|uniref:Uncharacterized protein n=1 Tax=Methylobacterium aerolatum TaxID=418708 RepID=A0ABU0HWF4_9HYPH|nr:hypothetical protein [Methylobacterium aerolatum]
MTDRLHRNRDESRRLALILMGSGLLLLSAALALGGWP